MDKLTGMFEEATGALAALDEDALFGELGRRSLAIADEPDVAGVTAASLSFDELGFDLPDLINVGKRLFRNVSAEAHKLVCTEEGAYDEERRKIREVFDAGSGAVTAALAASLVSGIGLAPAIAAVIAAIAIKLFFRGTLAAMCGAWKEWLA